MLGKSLLFLVVLLRTCTGIFKDTHRCDPSFCGNDIISHPFRLKTDPVSCGYPEYELNCENSRTVLYLDQGKYYVQSINYKSFTIRMVDAGLLEDTCSSTPFTSFECNKHLENTEYSCNRFYYNTSGDFVKDELSRTVTYVECANEIDSPLYTKTSACIKSQNLSSAINKHLYIVDAYNASCIENTCTIRSVSKTSMPRSKSYNSLSYEDIHKELVYGFQLSWLDFLCKGCNRFCYVRQENHTFNSQCNEWYAK